MRLLILFFCCLLLIACENTTPDSPIPIRKFKVVEVKEYIAPHTGLLDPVIIPVIDSRIKRIQAGKPNLVAANTNVRIAGRPKSIPAGEPYICTPGKQGFSLPKVTKAVGRKVTVGEPEVVIAGEMGFKDQNPASFRYFGKLQGLKTVVVQCILEDRFGNIWFGTDGVGVTRYDGKSFTHFTPKDGLGTDKVSCMFEDRSGNIWFGSAGKGVIYYDGKQFRQFTSKDGLGHDFVTDIQQDQKGNIWFATDGGGVSLYNGDSFIGYTIKVGLSNDKVTSILEGRDGTLWFGTDGGGVCRYDGESFFHFTNKTGLGDDAVSSILQDKSGDIWFGTYGSGVTRFDGKLFYHYTTLEGLNDNVIMDLSEDRMGNIWFSTFGNGVICFDGKNFSHFTSKQGLSHDQVSDILEDRSGNLWFGTIGGGVNRYDGNLFSHITTREGLSNDAVTSILQDRFGNLWLGTHGGAIRYDGKTFAHFTTKEGLIHDAVSSILEDSTGNIWFGTFGGGVCSFNGRTFSHFTTRDGLSNDEVTSLLKDRTGNLWIGTFGGGVCRFDGKSFLQYTTRQGLSNDNVSSLLEDKEGVLWIGTDGGGITRIDSKTISHITSQQGLRHDRVSSILEDHVGNLWFGTYGGGVIRFDGKRLIDFCTEQGMSNDFILSAAEDDTSDNGSFWFGSRAGLNKVRRDLVVREYDPNNPWLLADDEILFKSFGYNDGFIGIGCNRTAMFKAKDGRLWVGSNDRLTVVNTGGLFKDTVAPVIKLTAIDLFNEKIHWSTTGDSKKRPIKLGNGVTVSQFSFDSLSSWYNLPSGLSLTHNNNFLNFRYIGITMHQPDKVRYKYKLEGFDDNWSTLTNRTEAPYGNLPHGTYTFKVKAMNSEGYWSPECTYTFTIRPPWWKTPAAYGAYSALFVLAYVGSLRWNSRRVRKRTLVLKQAVDDATAQIRLQQEWEMRKLQDENLKNIVKTQEDERVRIGRDLHDDLGARLSTLKLMLQSVFKKEGAPQEPVRESSLSMLDSAIRDMRGIITNLAPKSLQDNGYLKAVEELVNTIAKTETITFELSMHGMDRRFESEFENSLFRITQELINNSLKYANASRITIGVIGDHEKIRLTYEDDGTGIDPDKMNKGYGLNNIRARATLYKGDFYIDTATAKGFRCEITLYPPD